MSKAIEVENRLRFWKIRLRKHEEGYYYSFVAVAQRMAVNAELLAAAFGPVE